MIRASLFVLSTALTMPVTLNAVAVTPTNVTWGDVKTAHGTVKSFDDKAGTFVLSTGGGKEAKDVTIKVNKDTKFTLDGKASTAADVLKAGNKVTVKHSDNTAAEVTATTAKKP